MQLFKKLTLASTVLLALFFVSCNNQAAADNATIADAQQASQAAGTAYIIDSNASRLRFTGYGVGKNHPGNFSISEGTLQVADQMITSGNFTIDINSMKVEEEGAIFQDKLRPHLLNEDFLDAQKYGKAYFEITGLSPYNPTAGDSSVVEGANYSVSGNLTLKDLKKNISFPAHVSVSNNQVTAKANFNIDRRDWNMHYGNDKSLGDKFISEKVNIQINLVAKP